MPADKRPILSTIAADRFVGRTDELSLLNHKATTGSDPVLLLAPPLAGTTELLRQLFDSLFQQGNVIPFYFELPSQIESVNEVALTIFDEFNRQLAAFRSRLPDILRFAPTRKEIFGLVTHFDAQTIKPVLDLYDESVTGKRNLEPLVSIPIRLHEKDQKVLIIFDGMHNCDNSEEGNAVKKLILSAFNKSGLNVIFSGRRRSMRGFPGCGRIDLQFLNFKDSGEIIENMAADAAVEITDTARDLIALQCGGRPALIRYLITKAGARNAGLKTFKEVQNIYAEELVDGGIKRIFESLIFDAAKNDKHRKEIFKILSGIAASTAEKNSIEELFKVAGMSENKVLHTLSILNSAEIISSENGMLRPNPADIALKDLLWVKAKILRLRETAAYSTRSLAVGNIILSLIEKAPRKMAAYYRELSSLGLKDMMARFDGRSVPASLLDYAIFSDQYKGLPKDTVLEMIALEKTDIKLPDIAYTVTTASIYKPLADFIEDSHGAAAFGFECSKGIGIKQVVWLAAEIDSKLEAEADVAEFWCDRLETAALMSSIENFRLWLIAPEGFTAEALELLASRNCIGSNRFQVKLLKEHLTLNTKPAKDTPDHEALFIMGDETEISAANTVEKIAKEHNFPAKAINQMKTAVVEAFINAAEHSHSPDRKIHLGIKFKTDRLIITVSNRGLRLIDRMPATESEEKRRGWGLKLIRKLMDEVEIEPVDDGTKIKMTKYLAA